MVMIVMVTVYIPVMLGALFGLPPADQPQEREESVWEFLGKINEKDRFSYDICDSRFLDSATGDYGRCYGIEISVENIIYIKNNTFYYTHAITRSHGDDGDGDGEDGAGAQQDRLFLIDADQYRVRPIFFEDRDYATSLQNTIFWRGGWGDTVSTQYGARSVNVEANDPDTAMIVTDASVAHNGAMQYTATHERFGKSFFTINDDVPLPVSAAISEHAARHEDDAQRLFSFELKSFQTVQNTPAQNVLGYGAALQGASVQDGQGEDNEDGAAEDQTAHPEILNGHFEVRWR